MHFLSQAVYKFVDPNTRDNIVFVNTEDYDESGTRCDGKSDVGDFSKYIGFLRLPFDEDKARVYLSQGS